MTGSAPDVAPAVRQPVPHLLGAPHHDGSEVYVADGVPALGETVPVRVRVPAGHGVRGVHLRVLKDGEPGYIVARPDRSDDADEWYVAEIDVHNPVTRYRAVLRLDGGYRWLTGTGLHDRDVTDDADFRLSVHGGGPAWARDSVVYQIFPDRFARSGIERALPPWALPAGWDEPVIGDLKDPLTPLQFYGGDLAGIEQRLGYLQDLGIRTVYLTPIFPGESNHRYNATTFESVDPLLGGDEALASLSAAVHARGMHLIGDFTTNHTGDTHEWFRRAVSDPDSLERGYYYWRDEEPGYVGWYDVPTLPKLNYNGHGLLDRMVLSEDSVTARWMRPPYALDGWRIDVANMTGRYRADDFARDVARAMRTTMGGIKPDSVLIAEHNFDAAADLVGDGWHGTMNYAGFMRPVWSWLASARSAVPTFLGMPNGIPRRSGASAAATMREVLAGLSWPVALSCWNSLDTHDTPRLPEVTGDPTVSLVGIALLFTYPGTPMMFAGLEIGAGGLSGEYGRIPMPWHRPEAFATETFRAVRELIHLRNSVRALREGGLRWAMVHDDALAFLRETADERILVVLARAPWPGSLLPSSLVAPGGTPENLYGGGALRMTPAGLEVPGDGPGAQVWRLA